MAAASSATFSSVLMLSPEPHNNKEDMEEGSCGYNSGIEEGDQVVLDQRESISGLEDDCVRESVSGLQDNNDELSINGEVELIGKLLRH